MVAPVPAQISKLPRRKLPCPSRRTSPNSRPVNLLQASFPLFCSSCPLFSTACSLFSQNTRDGGTSAKPSRPLRLFTQSLEGRVILRLRFGSLLLAIPVPSPNYL